MDAPVYPFHEKGAHAEAIFNRLSSIYHHGICNPAAGWFVYKADRHPAAAGTERNERSKPSMFQGLGPLLSLLGGGSFTKLLLFLLKGLFG